MTASSDPASLDLSPEEMRRLGHRVVDALVDHWSTLRDHPALAVRSRRDAEAALGDAAPEEGRDPDEVFRELYQEVFPWGAQVQHPRFFGFVPGPSNFISVLTDALASGFNTFAGSWLGGSGAAAVELKVVDWLRRVVGFPERAGGLFVSGGSMANLTALAVARQARLGDDREALARATAYVSDQTHSAVERALCVLGVPRDGLRRIPTDGEQRLSTSHLEDRIRRDRDAGRRPFVVNANAGTTNTGAVDPLPELVDLCRREDLWLHVDGAYGASALLTDEGRTLLEGLDRVDSLALDPHKWLFQPFECGCVLVRDRRLLPEAFAVHPEYLEDLDLGLGEVDFLDHGIQLTRSPRALKLWASLQVFGVGAFRDAVERGFEHARRVQTLLEEAGIWTIVTPARMGIVTFRHRDHPPGAEGSDGFHQRLTEALRDGGIAFQSTTRIHGATVLRLCTINPRTTEEDLRLTVEALGRYCRDTN